MKCELLKIVGSWNSVVESANVTINKTKSGEPKSSWKRKILLAEHSPIRELIYSFKWSNLKYWVSVHFVRHKIGIEHFVRTQRQDRTGIDRNELRQDSLVEHKITLNAQAIINISKKRLCKLASKETREAWIELLNSLKIFESELYSVCVPDCVYRGKCREFKSCGFDKTEQFKIELNNYQKD